MMDNKEQLHVVTEVGVFGELDVNDPTAKKVKKDGEEDSSDVALEQLIEDSIKQNLEVDA